MSENNKIIALTMGDPASIAPEITLKAWHKTQIPILYIGCAQNLKNTARKLNLNIPIKKVKTIPQARHIVHNSIAVLNLPLNEKPIAGQYNPKNDPQIIQSIKKAAELTIKGETIAIVTNPIQKKSLQKQNIHHNGHTQWLAQIAREKGLKIKKPVMMLEINSLKTIPLTTHIPIREIQIQSQDIITTTRIIHDALIKYHTIKNPIIAIAGLNPHAGENGLIGDEEQKIIQPAIEKLKKQNINVTGPIPADSMFYQTERKKYHAALCMYHDQALIPIKTLDLHNGINITLGLPFIRTSPDHGTAFNIAGKGKANEKSLIAALKKACQMYQNSQKKYINYIPIKSYQTLQ